MRDCCFLKINAEDGVRGLTLCIGVIGKKCALNCVWDWKLCGTNGVVEHSHKLSHLSCFVREIFEE